MDIMFMKNVFWIIVIMFLGYFAYGQEDTSRMVQILCKDGNQYIGKIISDQRDTIWLDTENLGVIKIPASTIKSSSVVKPTVDSEGTINFWPVNHHATRYFFGPNGHSLKKGEGYYQNNWVFFNQISFGVSDNVTMGIGMVPIFLLGADVFPVWLTPKVSFDIKEDKFSLGAGGLVGSVIGENEGVFGVAYGITTFGSRDVNASVGFGYGYGGNSWAESPTVSLSAMVRASKKFYLITENYWFGIDDIGLISLGGRTAWPSVALDYGGIIPIGADETIIIPWLGISVPFGF